MIDFVTNNILLMAIKFPSAADCSVLGADFTSILNEVFMWIQIATPCLVILLCSVDLAKGVIAQDDKAMQQVLPTIVKRVGIGVAIFFVPILLNFILMIAGFASGLCNIGM